MTTTLDSRHFATDPSEPAQFQLRLQPIVDCNYTIPLPVFLICADISVRHGDAVAFPTLKNWPLFGQKFSKFGQSIQPHSHVSKIVSILQTKAK